MQMYYRFGLHSPDSDRQKAVVGSCFRRAKAIRLGDSSSLVVGPLSMSVWPLYLASRGGALCRLFRVAAEAVAARRTDLFFRD